jgi:hypothetical protein
MSTQDDDLKLEPPQAAQPPAPAPAPVPPPAERPAEPPAEREPESALQPGQGKPLVEGPPMSVNEPIAEETINRTAAFAGIGLLGLGLIVAVILLLVIVFALCR